MGRSNHVEELEQAVLLARRRLAAAHLDEVPADGADRGLAAFLHRRWYLGLEADDDSDDADDAGDPRDTRPEPWQSWSADWTPSLAAPGSDLVRLRLSAPPTTALHALAVVTEHARGWDVPWRLTSSALRAAHPTPESTVVDLPVDALLGLRPEIERLVADLGRLLDRRVPALTLQIGRGASLAQQPSDGRSFGEHRCALVASTVLATMRCHPREQVARTMTAFAAAGIDPQRPYRMTGGAAGGAAAWDRPWRAA